MVARTLEEMRAAGMDVLVGASPAALADLADYRNWIDPLFREYMMRPGASSDLQQALVLLTSEGEVTLLVSAEMAANARDTTADRIVVWGSDEAAPRDLPDGFEKVAEAFGRPRRATRTEALLDLLGAAARVGAEREALAAGTWEALAGGGRGAGDCTNLLRLGRMVKDEAQIALLQRAAEAAEYAAAETLAVASVGSSWRELTDLYRMKLAEHGADLDHFSGSPTGFGLATEADYRLPERGSMYFDHGCRLRSWFSDTGHTIAFGPPDDPCRRRQASVRDALPPASSTWPPARRPPRRRKRCAKPWRRRPGRLPARPRHRPGGTRLPDRRPGHRPPYRGRLRQPAGRPAAGGGHGAEPGVRGLGGRRQLRALRAVLRHRRRRLPAARRPAARRAPVDLLGGVTVPAPAETLWSIALAGGKGTRLAEGASA